MGEPTLGQKWVHFSIRKLFSNTVHGILKNEKYMGDALLQKTITIDFIEKVRIKNDGSAPQYYVTDNHEPIIPRNIFHQVQEEIERRTSMYSVANAEKKRCYSGKYALTSKCVCGECGDIYRRVVWNNRGRRSVVWRCVTRIANGPSVCDSPTISEEELQQATIKAINELVKCSPSTIDTLLQNIEIGLADDGTDELEAINEQLSQKQKLLIKLAHEKKDYSNLADEIDTLKQQKQNILLTKAKNEAIKERMKEIKKFLKETPNQLIEYDESLVRKYIEKVLIYEDTIKVLFKSGIEIEVKKDNEKS